MRSERPRPRIRLGLRVRTFVALTLLLSLLLGTWDWKRRMDARAAVYLARAAGHEDRAKLHAQSAAYLDGWTDDVRGTVAEFAETAAAEPPASRREAWLLRAELAAEVTAADGARPAALRRKAAHHAHLADKYRAAARAPWAPVAPDPPEPD